MISLGVFVAATLVAGLATAAISDSRDPVDPAPVYLLGPPTAAGASVTPAGATLEVEPTRRSARVIAAWTLSTGARDPQGPLEVVLESSLFQVQLSIEGSPAPLPVESERIEDAAPGAAAPEAAPVLLIDPSSGRVYARLPPVPSAPPAPLAPAPRFRHRAVVMMPPSGRVVLLATAVLFPGTDRAHWRRRSSELSHALHVRPDPLIYQYAVQGPGGPVRLVLPPHTAGSAVYVEGVLRAAVATPRPFPLGLTVGVGGALSGGRPDGLTLQGAARVGLDGLLPWGDALSLSADGVTRFTGDHALSASLVYQLYTPPVALFPMIWFTGHLEAGPALSILDERGVGPHAGLRLGLGLHLSGLGVLASADLFPESVPPPPGETGAGHYDLRYRLALLLSVGL